MSPEQTLDYQIRRPGSNALVRDYIEGTGRSADFFGSDWRDPGAYRAQAARLAGRSSDWAEALSVAGPTAQARLDRVLAEDGYVVVTGQQPGLFSGPLYSVWKALSAIRLADELEGVVGRPVLPVFWVASEDHDWEETDHTWMIGVDNDLHRVALESVPGAGDAPLHRLDIQTQMEARIAEVAALLPETEMAQACLERLKAAYGLAGDGGGTGVVSLASGFQAFLEGLLEPLGMAFVQAHDPALKRLSSPILEAGFKRAEEIETALSARAGELEGVEYPVQVPILEGGVNLFLESEGRRERLYRDGDGFVTRHSGVRCTAPELEAILESDPQRLSPNVHLRPIVEAAVFPSLAYVAGPGELTYYAQLAPAYETLGVSMPVIYPRLGVSVRERKIGKVIDKFALEDALLARPFHEIAQEFARDEVPEGVRKALGEIRGAIGKGVGELTQAAAAVDPTLKGPIGSARGAAFAAFADAEKAILKAVKRESETKLQQIEKAKLHLYPDGAPQERKLNLVYYLARYGAQMLQDVLDQMEPGLQGSDPKS